MAATRRERFEEFMRRVCDASPFPDFSTAWAVVRDSLISVEDELTEIPLDPNAHLARVSDGRMYPPHERFEVKLGSPHIRAFRQIGHLTSFGSNGALRIERLDGMIELDLAGADGKTISELRLEVRSEAN